MSFDEIVCREFSELATDYLEAALPEETLQLVEEHLAMCDWCRDYLRQIETTARTVAAVPEAPEPGPPPETLHALVHAFRAHATKEDGAR
jgi:predicted anti-sigma-YlaC factor YlaD